MQNERGLTNFASDILVNHKFWPYLTYYTFQIYDESRGWWFTVAEAPEYGKVHPSLLAKYLQAISYQLELFD